jgi:hypothetical protein
VTIALAGLLSAVAIAAIVVRRAHRIEALTILIIALPIVLWVPPNAPRWYDQLRRDHNRDSDSGHAVTPIVIAPIRNPILEQQTLAAVPPDETYAVVAYGHWRAQSQKGTLTYLESWLQFQLAPRIRADPEHANWLIMLGGAGDPLPSGTTEVYYLGDDRLVRQ